MFSDRLKSPLSSTCSLLGATSPACECGLKDAMNCDHGNARLSLLDSQRSREKSTQSQFMSPMGYQSTKTGVGMSGLKVLRSMRN